jgi:hypothetical protein
MFGKNILLKKECIKIRAEEEWQYWESFNEQVNIKFKEAMTQIMVNQMNPNFWQNNLEPVKDISFTKDHKIKGIQCNNFSTEGY